MHDTDQGSLRSQVQRRFLYGWTIVAITGVTLLVALGTRRSFSVFFAALIDEYGWSRASTSLVSLISAAALWLAASYAGQGQWNSPHSSERSTSEILISGQEISG